MLDTHQTGFAHQRLDAYRIAQQLARGIVELTARMPRGFSDLRDQMNRAALATVRHIAEGANRASPADKRARFVVARGELGELDASLETATLIGSLANADAAPLHAFAARVGAMLTGLIRRQERLL